ncbi:MAG: signal peptidase I [Candidatus Bathyarchaeia archaeon]
MELRRLIKNEYFEAIATLAIISMIILGFYTSVQIALGTENFALAVASGSMLPTLNIGDLIIVQRADPAQIRADRLTGDILVFRNPWNPNELIVHRAIKIERKGNHFLVTTLGDNCEGDRDQFSPWNSSLLIGRVIGRIPYLGVLSLIIRSNRALYTLFIAVLVILVIALIFTTIFEAKSGDSEEIEEKASSRKLEIIEFIAVNALLLAFFIFSLWGSFSFQKPDTGERMAILGMYQDLGFHKKFCAEAILHYSFFTYRIDCLVCDGIRYGVSTFAWHQLIFLILVAYDIWKIYTFLKIKRNRIDNSESEVL